MTTSRTMRKGAAAPVTFLVLAGLMGCMATPRNGEVYAHTESPVTLQAYVPSEGALLKYEAAVFNGAGKVDHWRSIASCAVGPDPYVDPSGDSYYTCSATLTNGIPYECWTAIDVPSSYAARAKVRAFYRPADGSPSQRVWYFDTGSETTKCVTDHLSNSVEDAVIYCSKGDSSATVYAKAWMIY